MLDQVFNYFWGGLRPSHLERIGVEMLLEDCKKMPSYIARIKREEEERKRKESEATTVTGIMTASEGVKEVEVSLGGKGLEIKEKKPVNKKKRAYIKRKKKNPYQV